MLIRLIFTSTRHSRRPKIIKVKNEDDILRYIEQYNLNIDKYLYHYCGEQIRIVDFEIITNAILQKTEKNQL